MLVRALGLLGFIAIQVVVLGGVWAALAGAEFLFWSFDQTNVGAAALIIFVVDPIAMAIGGLLFGLLGAVFSIGQDE